MDPNANKRHLLNKLNKKEALKRLEKENLKRRTVSFYRYVPLHNLTELRDKLFFDWQKMSVLGRIYLANEGINAQLSIPEKNWEHFVFQLYKIDEFKNIPFKKAVEDKAKSFFKLTIKIKKQIVSDGLTKDEYDVTNVGTHLSAVEWNEAMNSGAIVVDMRNHYESEIGHFEGAICPQVESFRDELPIVKSTLKGKEDSKVLLYCTGGIRCEKASAYLKHHGFNDVSQLHGGIIDYMRQIQENPQLSNKFKGKNFVFDERLSERISDDVISNCHQCGVSADTHVNCQNLNCNLLFIQCESCQEKNFKCCSPECIEVYNLPEKKQKNIRKGVVNKKRFHSHKKVDLSKSFNNKDNL